MKRIKIAITGGIGSGKSTLLQYLKELGYPCFSCDEIYQQVLLTPSYVEEVKKEFPECILDGKINKKLLSNIIFQNAERRAKLNSLAHPHIMENLNHKMEQTEGIVFAEVPLLFEGGYEYLFNKIIVVLRSNRARIDSLLQRDGGNRQEILQKISTQFNYTSPEAQHLFANPNIYVLSNNGNPENLQQQIRYYLDQIKQL